MTPLTPKRIALFTGAYNHIADGVALTLNRLVSHLEACGNDVVVFAPTVEVPAIDPHAGRLVSAASLPIPRRHEYRITLGLTPRIRSELKAFRPTLVHIATPDALGFGASRWARRRGIPVVSSYHTHFSSYLSYYKLDRLEPVLWRYLSAFYTKCRQVYVPSLSMAEVLRSHGITERLYLWERGVDTGRFNPAHRSLEWRRSVGIDEREVVLAFVSRLVIEKGLDIFAEVVEGLQRRGIPHRSLVVGDGPARGDLQARLPNTIFTGTLRGDDLGRAYASSDLFLFPSHTETFGNVTLEAMASGLPTVCADATGSRSLVVDGVTGYLAPPQDGQTFLERVSRLLVNPSLRMHMGHRALDRAHNFAWPVILGKLDGYYDALLNPEIRTLEVDLSPAETMASRA